MARTKAFVVRWDDARGISNSKEATVPQIPRIVEEENPRIVFASIVENDTKKKDLEPLSGCE